MCCCWLTSYILTGEDKYWLILYQHYLVVTNHISKNYQVRFASVDWNAVEPTGFLENNICDKSWAYNGKWIRNRSCFLCSKLGRVRVAFLPRCAPDAPRQSASRQISSRARLQVLIEILPGKHRITFGSQAANFINKQYLFHFEKIWRTKDTRRTTIMFLRPSATALGARPSYREAGRGRYYVMHSRRLLVTFAKAERQNEREIINKNATCLKRKKEKIGRKPWNSF